MHASTVLFAPLALMAGLVAARPADSDFPATGLRCCNGGTGDATEFCKCLGLDSFCCSGFDAGRPGGCDDFAEFPTGRTVQQLVPGGSCTVPGIKVSNPLPGFIGCVSK
ncbi:hypothetical protein LZ32DRAFT_629380 [Colletotrichum eremochloae]|nr:hypothetical protein LZ32DRAFT_629380 [Colletotrichum eremochloae]